MHQQESTTPGAVPESSTAPAVTGHRWAGKKTAIVAAMAIGLSSAGAVGAAAALPEGTGASQGGGFGPGGGRHGGPMGQPGGMPGGMPGQGQRGQVPGQQGPGQGQVPGQPQQGSATTTGLVTS